MALDAGNISETRPLSGNTMAKLIEDAFMTEWSNAMGAQPLPEHNKQMQLLFVAVAKGVVEHLKNNPLSISIQISSGDLNNGTGTLTIMA